MLNPALFTGFIKKYVRYRSVARAVKNPIRSVRFLKRYLDAQAFLKRITEREIPDFVSALTGVDRRETAKAMAEILENREFNDVIWGTLEEHEKVLQQQNPGFGTGAPTRNIAVLLYTVIRAMKPEAVVETGVANGVSTSYILRAMEDNNRGSLVSLDLPYRIDETQLMDTFSEEGKGWPVPEGRQPGWLVPDELRARWKLVLGKTAVTLEPALKELGSVDIFIHDSEHSYDNMLWEYTVAWPHVRENGLLLSHDINWNNAFHDFYRTVRGTSSAYGNDIGGIVKPGGRVDGGGR